MMHITLNSETVVSRVKALGLLAAVPVIALLFLVAGPANGASTFTVDSTADYGDQTPGDGKCDVGTIMLVEERCTLRAAIQQANASPVADIINFGIPTNGVATIGPETALPEVTKPVTINGYSQMGAKPNTKPVGSDAVLKIELSGAGAPGKDGLVLGAPNSIVKGLVINRWNQGIRIDGPDATGNRITGNFIGTDASGTQKLGNYAGVRFYYGSGNTIGGTSPAERNVISGNGHSGVAIGDGVVVKGNRVVGNYIGTDKTGTKDLGNASYGVNIDDAPNNSIGGTTTGERNVISGNGQQGISIFSNGTRVLGNYVGTDSSGTKDLGNGENGVHIEGANNTVGGTTTGARNVISANTNAGVSIQGSFATNNRVVGNHIGTDRSGTRDLGNFWGVRLYDAPNNTVGGTTAAERNVASGNTYGVLIGGAPGKNTATGNRVVGNYVGTDASGTGGPGNLYDGVVVVDASNNTVGGTTAGARNVIASNGRHGVIVSGAGATGNRVLSNSIFSNGGLGIDLNYDGVTANDPDDADTGPNNLQNFPVLSTVRKGAAGTTTVRGTLNSTPNATFRVQFFSNPEGTDEGKTLLGSQTVSTNGAGDASFAFATKKPIRLGQNVTATATGPGGNSSEFSAPRRVVAP